MKIQRQLLKKHRPASCWLLPHPQVFHSMSLGTCAWNLIPVILWGREDWNRTKGGSRQQSLLASSSETLLMCLFQYPWLHSAVQAGFLSWWRLCYFLPASLPSLSDLAGSKGKMHKFGITNEILHLGLGFHFSLEVPWLYNKTIIKAPGGPLLSWTLELRYHV